MYYNTLQTSLLTRLHGKNDKGAGEDPHGIVGGVTGVAAPRLQGGRSIEDRYVHGDSNPVQATAFHIDAGY